MDPRHWPNPSSDIGEAATDEFAVIHGLYWLTVNLAEQRPMAILVDDVPGPMISRCASWSISPNGSRTFPLPSWWRSAPGIRVPSRS